MARAPTGVVSLVQAAADFARVMGIMTIIQETALEHAAAMLRDEARSALGTYRYDWPPLQPATVSRKAVGDTPLLETGELRDSIQSNASSTHGWFGSDDDKAVWHEFGTKRCVSRCLLVDAPQVWRPHGHASLFLYCARSPQLAY